MSTLDLSSLGVSAVDVETIQQNVINQVKQSKKNALNKELENTDSTVQHLKSEIKKIDRILRHSKQNTLILSPKEMRTHLKKQKQLTKQLQTQLETKTQILDKLKLIEDTIDPKRGKKRAHHQIQSNEWHCTRCTLLNDDKDIRCTVCNTIRSRHHTNDIEPSVTVRPHKRQKTTHKTAIYRPYTHICDDADDHVFEARLQSFYEYKSMLNEERKAKNETEDISDTFYDDSLGFIDVLSKRKYASIDNNNNNVNNEYLLPLWLYNALYKFQQKGVQWLCKLYNKEIGGILGDDMGLGKTIQIIAFLSSLRLSQRGGAVLIMCPASVLMQWVRECHRWAPQLRVMLLHDTGRHKASKSEIINKLYDCCMYNNNNSDEYNEFCGGVLITTYKSLCLNDGLLLPIKWGLCVLDEGHKIRNPNASITMICKQLKCRHRLILSGSPLQNTLSDLWSLFDFIFPGRLATLPLFEEQFVYAIKCGGYSHSTMLQIEESIATANILKDIIDPYILRRTKENVKHNFFIPNKTEQVLFCKLTETQLIEYKNVLNSNEMKHVCGNNEMYYDRFDRNEERLKRKKGFTFKVITKLKKICNHCDLLQISNKNNVNNYGDVSGSGKLQILCVILKKWFDFGHKSLIFCQTKQFLDIVEACIGDLGYIYRRLDGSTAVRKRQTIISCFNEDDSIFLLLLTTRAGGLGINLCGANRVIVMDPDWNPSIDSQSKERCYRIGQKRDVTIYRFITKGTIEEKVYHRQIYKQFLTDKVLKDPNNQRVFNEKDLKDLFSLDLDENINKTEDIFCDLNASITCDNNNNNNCDETEILTALFSSNGIASAFRHNHIQNMDEMERAKLEKSAKKMAKRALKALEKSRMKINNELNITQPTWTGTNGFNCNAIHQKRKRFGNHSDLMNILQKNTALSSATLLHKINAKKGLNNNEKRKKIIDLKDKKYEVLVHDLYHFVKNQNNNGGIATNSVIQHFDHRLHNEQEQYIFKIILQKMCRLTSHSRSKSKAWILKDKYLSLSL